MLVDPGGLLAKFGQRTRVNRTNWAIMERNNVNRVVSRRYGRKQNFLCHIWGFQIMHVSPLVISFNSPWCRDILGNINFLYPPPSRTQLRFRDHLPLKREVGSPGSGGRRPPEKTRGPAAREARERVKTSAVLRISGQCEGQNIQFPTNSGSWRKCQGHICRMSKRYGTCRCTCPD